MAAAPVGGSSSSATPRTLPPNIGPSAIGRCPRLRLRAGTRICARDHRTQNAESPPRSPRLQRVPHHTRHALASARTPAVHPSRAETSDELTRYADPRFLASADWDQASPLIPGVFATASTNGRTTYPRIDSMHIPCTHTSSTQARRLKL